MDTTKEMIEKILGYKIEKFELEPHFDNDGTWIGIDVFVQPKTCLEHLNISIKIAKTSDFDDNPSPE
jgi:hypothetical protein